jgi:predicted transcriptional regulator of viral defense system
MSALQRWDQLYEAASCQMGYFTTAQAATVNFSDQLLEHHLRTGRLKRVQRGIYRLSHFPYGDYDDLIVLWLW